MFAYECGSLKNCNEGLSEYGSDSMKGRDRIAVKVKPGQESGIERHNIQVVSFLRYTKYLTFTFYLIYDQCCKSCHVVT